MVSVNGPVPVSGVIVVISTVLVMSMSVAGSTVAVKIRSPLKPMARVGVKKVSVPLPVVEIKPTELITLPRVTLLGSVSVMVTS